MDPYRQQYPPYQGQPPQQQGPPPPHMRHGGPPPQHYGPPPGHMPMYPGGPPPPGSGAPPGPYQQYPPHMQHPPHGYPGAPPPHLQQPHQQQPPPHYPLQHHQQPPYGGVPPPHQHQQHQHQRLPPRSGPGYRPPAGGPMQPPPSAAPMSIGGHAGYTPAAPPSSQALKAAAPPPTTTAPTMAIGGALPDKMNTLFIGSIAPGINNIVMEKLLKTTGELVRWKRVQDPTSQQWKAFGFAEYANADSLLRTLRVLGQDGKQPKGEKPVGLELTAMDGSGTVKALLVKADEKTRQFLDQYDESRPRTIMDAENDKVALSNAMKIIQQMKDGTLDTTGSESETKDESTEDTKTSATTSTTNFPHSHQFKLSTSTAGEGKDLPKEQQDLIDRELAFFKERAAIKEKERKEEEEKAERHRSSQLHKQQQREQREREREREREKEKESQPTVAQRMGRERAWGAGPRGVDFVAASTNGTSDTAATTTAKANGTHDSGASTTATTTTTSMDVDPGVDSEDEEKARQERRDRELEQSYKERERRWEQKETERLRLMEKDRVRDEEAVQGLHAAKEALKHRFALWDDNLERERRQESYYRDRSRWWQKRQVIVEQEQRYDNLDREEEKEELAHEAAKKVAAAKTETEKSAVAHDQDTEMTDATSNETATSESTSDPAVDPSTILPTDQPMKLRMNLTPSAGASLKRGPESNGVGSGNGTPTTTSGPTSSFLAANEFEQDEDEGKEIKKRRLFIPPTDNAPTAATTTTMTPEEKSKMEQEVKALFQSIPSDAAGLWSWPIQWQYVFEDKEAILREKILPFTTKKVIELLDAQEDDLINYVVDCIRKKLSPQELVEELRVALDADAEVLVMKIWRMLIFETESRARQLATK
ncbi:hypothetical protein BGZ83_005746 [Gryganskiella cystojenkinii]|nr:hypothetical protein BGZ83_005746 [Gryganskiella cystojenkinii]